MSAGGGAAASPGVPGGVGGGTGLGRGLTALLAVVVVLVLAFAGVLLWTLLGGSGGGGAGRDEPPAAVGSSPGADPSAAAPEQPSAPASTPPAGPVAFRLPSGNIACDLTESRVTCTIGSFTFAPPPVEGCAGTVGPVAVLDADGVSQPCVEGDPAPAPDVPVLEYGDTTTLGPWTCGSGTDGVTCTATGSGTGFRLASGAFTPLP